MWGTVGLAVAGFAMRLRAGEVPVDPNRVILMSDTHIDSRGLTRGKHDAVGAFKECVRQVAEMKPRPAAVLLLGDLTENNTVESFRLFRELLAPWDRAGIKYFLTLGNHDRAAIFFKALPEFRGRTAVPGGPVSQLVELPLADFAVIETAGIGSPDWFGTVAEADRAWLNGVLARQTDKPLLICGHHPVDRNPEGVELRQAPRFLAWIYGHYHQMVSKITRDGIRTAAIPSTGFPEETSGYGILDMSRANGVTAFRITFAATDPKSPLHGREIARLVYPPVIPVSMTPEGDWRVRVEAAGVDASVTVEGPETRRVAGEPIPRLPPYNPKGPAYARGAKLAGVRAQECSVRHALDPASLVLKDRAGAVTFVRGRDYEAELTWGCVGRLEGGAIGPDTPVTADYAYGTMRLDAVVLTAERKIVLRKGAPHVSLPRPPDCAPGELRLANIWVTPRLQKLGEAQLFPVLEQAFPVPSGPAPEEAERRLPKTLAKLRAGGTVRILAWGDSVTDGGYLPDRERDRWQEQFARRLRERFPQAKIELATEAWPGRNTASYRAEPPGSPHNYKEKVLDARPDLIVSEFVNDAGLDEEGVRRHYGRIRDEFRQIGAEWVILTPHYVRPDWMGLASEKGIDSDPRPYVKGLRVFAAESGIALADASLRWGRLWRQGLPYSVLLMNAINHPDPCGMGLFADALMPWFPR